ncbi:hypothetical protein ACFY9A_01290 [Streptomyces rubradiris]|uniref:hypothetical protein n=1 Tax=Streptomyces rubradiris TaxID=285531 RepID=UPI0036E6EE47
MITAMRSQPCDRGAAAAGIFMALLCLARTRAAREQMAAALTNDSVLECSWYAPKQRQLRLGLRGTCGFREGPQEGQAPQRGAPRGAPP